ncbi:MAG: ModD protein [Chlorobiales bacterium]|nr:ModD protein [Chlorobiales bacterium]
MILYQLPDNALEQFMDEDMPYGDLTTSLLGIGAQQGEITFTSRDRTVLCCTEEASRVFERYGATVTGCLKSGGTVEAGVTILTAKGSAGSLHAGWKVALNLLEYASGIATRTRAIVNSAREVNADITVLTTRKSFPGTKKVALKAIMAGGALPHRIGLSDSILVFKQHTEFIGGLESFLDTVAALKTKAQEHKIIVEAESADEALKIAAAGVDIVQVDKLSPDTLSMLVQRIRHIRPDIKISAAGGINADNAAAYAETGVDILVLSSVYFGKPADIGVVIHPLTQKK